MLGLCSSDSAIASVFLRDVDLSQAFGVLPCGSLQPAFCIGPEKFIIIRGSLLFQHLQGTGILFRRTRRLYRFLILSAQLRHLCSTSKQYHGRHCHRQQTNQYSFFHLRSPFIFCYLPSALIFGKCTVKGMVFAYL